MTKLLGLRTVIYAAPDLARAKAWYSALLGFGPYFDEPFYVGFNVGGYELGLDPDGPSPGRGGGTAYWGVENVDDAVARAVTLGAAVVSPVQAVGDGIRVATVADPAGNAVGLIENPHFELPAAADTA
jgi:predicted enzyme related to lactoylglutathione lyase